MNPDKTPSSTGISGRPSVSVIIPIYSGDSYLSEMLGKLCLSGLRRNSGKRIELVIVDDKSPLEAETAALVRAAAEWADVVYHRNPVNMGYIRSANKGMVLASGSRFLLCNSDTRLAPGALARLEAAMDADPGVGLAGPVTNGGYNTPLQQVGEPPAPLVSFSDSELLRIDDFGRSMSARGLETRRCPGRFCVPWGAAQGLDYQSERQLPDGRLFAGAYFFKVNAVSALLDPQVWTAVHNRHAGL